VVRNWREVGGADRPIHVLDRAEHTSMKVMVRRQLLGDSLRITPDATVLEGPDDMITSLAMGETSIGYLSLGNAILSELDLVPLEVDGVRPALDSFRRGEYPYHRPFGFVVGASPGRAAMQFVRFIYGEEGRRTTTALGFVPVMMELVIAVLPEQDLLAQEDRYAPLVRHLEERLGLQTSVQLRLLPDYGTVIDEFRSGRVNAAFLGSLAFALAHAQAGVVPIARPEKDGVSQYRGIIVTRKDSGVRDWSDLRGRSFGLVDRATTAGHLYPSIYFREHGVGDLEQFFGSVVYAGSHDLVFLKVAGGQLDAGAAKDVMLDQLARTRPEIADALRTIAVSAPVPNNAFVLGGSLDLPCFDCHALVPRRQLTGTADPPRQLGDLADTLGAILLGLHESEEGREVLAALGADRFVRTSVDDLEEVNRMIRQAGFDPRHYRP
jgi:phosphonate transport system substrate-binding protein